jgi:hypothetical protein
VKIGIRKLRELLNSLEEILRRADMQSARFGYPAGMPNEVELPIDEREVDEFIKGRTRAWRRSWLVSPLRGVVEEMREALGLPVLAEGEPTPHKDAPLIDEKVAERDGRVWEIEVTQADEPEANRTDYFTLYELAQHKGSLPYRIAATMQPGDSFTYVSEESLTRWHINCSTPGREEG